MTLLLCGTILLIALSICMFVLTDAVSYGWQDVCGFIGVVGGVASVIMLVICGFMGVAYVSSGYKAELINKEYGTHYTQAEVFYGSDVIDKIQQVKRQRIEINGNLLKDDGNK